MAAKIDCPQCNSNNTFTTNVHGTYSNYCYDCRNTWTVKTDELEVNMSKGSGGKSWGGGHVPPRHSRMTLPDYDS